MLIDKYLSSSLVTGPPPIKYKIENDAKNILKDRRERLFLKKQSR